MRRWAMVSWFVTLLAAACGGAPAQPPYQIHRLPSGEQIKVLSIGRINFSGSGPALVLKYQTDLNMSDTAALHAQAARIWQEFHKDAEQAQVTSAIVSANSPPSGGMVRRGRAYNFVYEKSADGTWREPQRR
jgi:hypothetical protein